MGSIVGFPNPVNEKAARTVASGVFALTLATVLLGALVDTAWLWLSAVLAAGFLARVVTGPTLSPLGQLATRVVAPRLGAPKLVAGPPKRFAQGMGAAMTGAAVVFQAFGLTPAVYVVLGLVLVASSLEAGLGFCIGCRVFALLMRLGWVPEETCAACADISLRYAQPV
jgi:hypothetical protein